MEEENLFEYEGVSYPESALREIYPETFDEYVEQGILKKLGDEEPVDVVDTQEESLYEYEGVSYPESSLRDLYPDDFDDYVEQGVLTKVDGLGKQIAVEDSAAARDMDLVSEDGSLEFPREAKKPKYLIDGKEVNRAYLNDNLYKSDFVDKLQEGTVDVEIFNDPKLEELLKRQSESGSQWGDKIEAFNSGLSTLASGVVGAPGFIVDVFEEITGVEADIDAIDYLDELSEDLSKKAEELNNQQRAYKDDFIGSISEGNILDAVNIGFNTVSNSAPIMIAAGLTGGAGGVTGALTSAATMSGIMIPAEYASTKIAEDEKIKELSDGDKLTRAFFRGGAEGVFEGLMGPVGARSFSLFKDGVKNLVKTTAKESGAEAAKKVAEGMGKKTALEVFKTFGISTAGEGGSEALTSLSQDLTDDYLGIQDLSVEEYMRNAAEAGALGVFMGGVTTGALGGAGQVMSYLPLRNQKVYQGAKTEVREKQESGEINNEEAKQMDDAIESAKVALDKTDPSLSEENQERVAKLIDERERIKLEIEGLDENQVPVQNKKNRIDEINKEISEIGIEKPLTEEETGVPITPEEPVSVETAPAEEVVEEREAITPKTLKDLETENKSTFPKIPSQNVFLNEVSQPEKETRDVADEVIESKSEGDLNTETISVYDIVPTQKNLTAKNLEAVEEITEAEEPIIVAEEKGKYYIIDGHHRLANSIMKGNENVDVKVVKPVETAPIEEIAAEEVVETPSLEIISEKYPDVTIDVFEDKKNKVLNLGRIIVPEGSRGEGIGTRAMQDLVDYADANNLKFTLTPSKEFGATSVTRLKKFYKQFGFVENKGRNRDFSHKESMYRVPELKEKVTEVTEVKEKPKPKRRGKTQVQKAIDEFVNKKIPSTDKVSMSEKQALNKQIRDFARGIREAYKDQRNFRKRANKLISDNFQLFGDLTPSKVKALTRRAINIDFSKPDSLDKFIDYAAGLEQKTEDNLYKDIVNDVKKKTSPSKLRKRKGGILRGKIANYEGKVLSNIHNFIKENDVDALQNRVNQLRNKQEQGVKLSENDIALLDGAIMSIELLSGNLNTAQNAQSKIEAIIEGGKSKYRENIEKRATEYTRLVIEALPAITGGKKLTDQFGKLEQGAKRRPLTEAIRERLTGFLDYGEGLRTLLDKIDRTAERDESGYGGFLDKEAYEPVAKGRRKKDSLDTLKINELSDKLNELYGKRKKKALRENQKPKNLGTFTDGNGNEVNLFLSQNQAYPLYQYMQDPNNMATFQEMGFTDEMLQAVEDFLTPEIKEWADWQMSEFFPKYYDEINAVYKEMNDIDLPKQKIYVPIIRNVDGLNEAQRGVNETLFGDPQSTYKSLKQRQNSKAPFDMTKDGNEKLMEYVEGMNRYISFSKPVKILNVIFKNKDVRNAIREFNSQETLTAIDGFIERIANNSLNMGQRIKLLDKLRGNTTIASLALAPTVTIKQLTSIPAYAADIPISKFISGLGAFARNPKRAAEILMQSEYMQKRYKEGFERDILEGMKRDYDDMLNGTSNLKNKLMFLVKWGDKGAILMGGYSVYKYHFDKAIASGKSREQAGKIALAKFEEATKLSQQSTNPEDLSQFQTMGSLAKLFTMYMTSPISYFRQERKSARDFVKGYKAGNKKLMRNAVKRFTIYHFALPLVFQYVASGLPGLLTDWDEEDEKDLMRAASIGSLNGVFIAGQLISYFGDILTDKAWVRGGKFSPSPAFDAIVDIMNESEDVINEWSKNPNKFSDDFMKEMIELGLSVDVAVGLPVNRVKKLIENWKTIADDNTLEVQEEIALGLGFSPYVVTPKKKAKTTEGRFKKSTREPKKSTREPKKSTR